MSRTNWASVEFRKRAASYAAAVSSLEHIPWQTLSALRNKCAKTTTDNCWWAMYDLSRPLIKAIDAELYRRKVKRARAQKLRRRAALREGESRE